MSQRYSPSNRLSNQVTNYQPLPSATRPRGTSRSPSPSRTVQQLSPGSSVTIDVMFGNRVYPGMLVPANAINPDGSLTQQAQQAVAAQIAQDILKRVGNGVVIPILGRRGLYQIETNNNVAGLLQRRTADEYNGVTRRGRSRSPSRSPSPSRSLTGQLSRPTGQQAASPSRTNRRY